MARAVIRLLRTRRGGTAVEHAIVLPVFLLVVLLVIETAWQFTVAAGIDHGTRRGARWASLGADAPEGMTRLDRVAQIVLTTAGLPLDSSRLTITPLAFPNHASLVQPELGVPGLGGPDQVVRWVVQYRSTLLTPFARQLLSAELLTYRSVFVVQNEPFPA